MIAVTIGTANWRAAQSLAAGEVAYDFAQGQIVQNMIWDAALNNMRPMTAQEIAAIPAQQKAARDGQYPDLAALRDQAQTAIANINTYLAIPSPTNAQAVAEVANIDTRQRAIIKALLVLVDQLTPP
jgi:hypothetical protein